VQWIAPEVCLGTTSGAVPATRASDVYMVGGLFYELMTAGLVPFHWHSRTQNLLWDRRRSDTPVPGFPAPLPGLLNKSVLEAADIDGVRVPWCTKVADPTGFSLEEAKAILAALLVAEPKSRPSLRALEARVQTLFLFEQGAELRARQRALDSSAHVVRTASSVARYFDML
jgi:hypothetical protein